MRISSQSALSDKFPRLTAAIFILKGALAVVGIVLAGTRMLPGQHTSANAPRVHEQAHFSVELVPIQRPVKLSRPARRTLSKDERVASCLESKGRRSDQLPSGWLTGTQLH